MIPIPIAPMMTAPSSGEAGTVVGVSTHLVGTVIVLTRVVRTVVGAVVGAAVGAVVATVFASRTAS